MTNQISKNNLIFIKLNFRKFLKSKFECDLKISKFEKVISNKVETCGIGLIIRVWKSVTVCVALISDTGKLMLISNIKSRRLRKLHLKNNSLQLLVIVIGYLLRSYTSKFQHNFKNYS